jgi:NADH-quinone oxidoreductase subunit L
VVTVPLILLAIPSVVIGGLFIGPVLFGDFSATPSRAPEHDVLARMGEHYHGARFRAAWDARPPPFWLAWPGCSRLVSLPEAPDPRAAISALRRFPVRVWSASTASTRSIRRCSPAGERGVWAAAVARRRRQAHRRPAGERHGAAGRLGGAAVVRHLQTGYLYHYAFAMIIGLLSLLGWFVSSRWERKKDDPMLSTMPC